MSGFDATLAAQTCRSPVVWGCEIALAVQDCYSPGLLASCPPVPYMGLQGRGDDGRFVPARAAGMQRLRAFL
eukprot:359406-Chlamydomonas_euryale.AAC.5